eukprot:gene14083-20034_t
MERAALTVLQSIPLIKPTSCSCVKGLAETVRIVTAFVKHNDKDFVTETFKGSVPALKSDLALGGASLKAMRWNQQPNANSGLGLTPTKLVAQERKEVGAAPLREPDSGSIAAYEDVYMTRLLKL